MLTASDARNLMPVHQVKKILVEVEKIAKNNCDTLVETRDDLTSYQVRLLKSLGYSVKTYLGGGYEISWRETAQ